MPGRWGQQDPLPPSLERDGSVCWGWALLPSSAGTPGAPGMSPGLSPSSEPWAPAWVWDCSVQGWQLPQRPSLEKRMQELGQAGVMEALSSAGSSHAPKQAHLSEQCWHSRSRGCFVSLGKPEHFPALSGQSFSTASNYGYYFLLTGMQICQPF